MGRGGGFDEGNGGGENDSWDGIMILISFYWINLNLGYKYF